MYKLRDISDRLISLSAFVGAVGLTVEMVIILADVIGRAFGKPLFGAHDIVTMSMVLVVFGGMALCDRQGGHIVVDLFEHRFPNWFNRFVDVFSALAGVVIFTALAWTVYESSKISVMLNLQTNLLDLPKAWFQYALCILSLTTALAMLTRAFELALRNEDIRKEGKDWS